MVSHAGYKANAQQELSASSHAFAGAVSGVITRALSQPLDVLKIRFQLQVEPIGRRGGGLYNGVMQAAYTIVRVEGLSALWKGHVPAQALSVTYGMAQFWGYAVLTKAASKAGGGDTFVSHGFCGAVGGVLGTLASFHFDTVRTRLVAQGIPKKYGGVTDALVKMVRQEGLLSVWQGIIPTLLLSAPYSGLTFYFYSIFSTLYAWSAMKGSKDGDSLSESATSAAVCGLAAGACAKTCVYPLDVLKKRLQIRGFEEARKQFGKVVIYSSPWTCLAEVTREEGLAAWYKGLLPSLIKSGFSTGIIFVTYEATCQVLANIERKEPTDR